MQVDVLPLERFNAVWRPNEPDRLTPVYVERVTIREALQGDLLPSLFGTVQLIEPTFGVRHPPAYLPRWQMIGRTPGHSRLFCTQPDFSLSRRQAVDGAGSILRWLRRLSSDKNLTAA